MKRYTVLDLREVKENLGDHYQHTLRDSYQGVCEVCSEPVGQSLNECPVCQTPIVWRNSPRWKLLFGSPDAYERLLNVVAPEETTGVELCRLAELPGFANQSEADRWRRVAKKLGESRMLGLVRHAIEKRGKGRAALAYALNLAEKISREQPRPRLQEGPRPSGQEKKVLF